MRKEFKRTYKDTIEAAAFWRRELKLQARQLPTINATFEPQGDTYDCGIYSLVATKKFLMNHTYWSQVKDWSEMYTEDEIRTYRHESFIWII